MFKFVTNESQTSVPVLQVVHSIDLTYRTVSSTFASNRMVHDIFVEPPRPNMNTYDGERNMPGDAVFDLNIINEM